MCRYSYVSGACANRHIDSTECIGEGVCRFSGTGCGPAAAAGDPQYDSEKDRWLTLFCGTHGRFLCEDGDDCAPLRAGPANVAFRQRHILEDGSETW
ncbi:MAG: hypothetical protein JSV90_08455 [Methanobacteriota archaeon]|nr:MAG: hypothetical protein JSV90_08455 [Euryarchaeota archaeon]